MYDRKRSAMKYSEKHLQYMSGNSILRNNILRLEAFDFVDEFSLVYYSLPVTSVTDYLNALRVSFTNYYAHVKHLFKKQ